MRTCHPFKYIFFTFRLLSNCSSKTTMTRKKSIYTTQGSARTLHIQPFFLVQYSCRLQGLILGMETRKQQRIFREAYLCLA